MLAFDFFKCLIYIFFASELWRKETQMTQTLSSHKEELAKADQALRSMAGRPILNGRDSVRKVLELFLERGGPNADIAKAYYGLVIENFSCDKTIYTAVEVSSFFCFVYVYLFL